MAKSKEELQNAYKQLGVNAETTLEEIKKLYKQKHDRAFFREDGSPIKDNIGLEKASQEAQSLGEAYRLIMKDRGFNKKERANQEVAAAPVKQSESKVNVPSAQEVDAAYQTLGIDKNSTNTKENIDEKYKKILHHVTMDKSSGALHGNAEKVTVLKEAYDHVMYDHNQKIKKQDSPQQKPRFPVIAALRNRHSKQGSKHTVPVQNLNQGNKSALRVR